MPDLGKYAAEVLLAYGVSIALLAVTVMLSWRQAVASKAALDKAEGRQNG